MVALEVRRGAGGERPVIVAHRGAWGAAPQNSLQAFDDAVTLGCDAIELDVRRTGDGRVVVLHEARVRGRAVGRLNHDELRARMQDGQAPELEEVLELTAGRIALDIELKEDGYVEQVMAIVARRLTPGEYVVSSFRDAALRAVSNCAPEARTGLLVGPRRRGRELQRRVALTGVEFLAIHASLIRTGLVEWSVARGLGSWVWTVNDARALATLLGDAHVDAVITDRPERALSISSRSGAA